MYGADTDAAAYLGKFVHLFFRLPNNAGRNFVPNVFARYGFATSDPGSVLVDRFKEHLGVWIEHANLSLRDVEQACALFALADDKDSPGLLAHLITLRIKKPTIYAGLLRNAREAHKEAVDWVMNNQRSPSLKEQTADDPHSPAFYLGRSPDTATVEDLRRYQLPLVDHGTSPVSLNHAITGLKFFFEVTLDRPELMVMMQPVCVAVTRCLPFGSILVTATALYAQRLVRSAEGSQLQQSSGKPRQV